MSRTRAAPRRVRALPARCPPARWRRSIGAVRCGRVRRGQEGLYGRGGARGRPCTRTPQSQCLDTGAQRTPREYLISLLCHHGCRRSLPDASNRCGSTRRPTPIGRGDSSSNKSYPALLGRSPTQISSLTDQGFRISLPSGCPPVRAMRACTSRPVTLASQFGTLLCPHQPLVWT